MREVMGALKGTNAHLFMCVLINLCVKHSDERHDRNRNRKGGGFNRTVNSKSMFGRKGNDIFDKSLKCDADVYVCARVLFM